jgi:DNA-binding beta-propeller fold protein YncE
MRTLSLIPLLALGCDVYTSGVVSDGALWDTNVITLEDGVYVRLPHAGRLVRVQDSGKTKAIDLKGASPVQMIATPDQESMIVFAEWTTCSNISEDIVLETDCEYDDLGIAREVVIVKDGKRSAVTDIPSHMNTLRFTPDGLMAAAFFEYDAEEDLALDGVMDPTVVSFVDLADGTTHSVSAGTTPREILFSEDGTRAIVLSQSEVVVVNMETFSVDISYPLTLDKDEEIDPSGAVLSPDGRYVLIAIAGTSDLFQLDLELVSVDLEALDSTPATLASDARTQTTVVTYGSMSAVDVITEHGFIERSEIQLDQPAPDVVMGDGFAVLYSDSGSGKDIYRLDLETFEVIEYVAANPVASLQLTQSEGHAVAILRPDSSSSSGIDGYQDARWGLAIADLAGDNIASLVLESEPVGLKLVEDGDSAHALLLLSGVESLIQVDLHNPGSIKQVELESTPAGIGSDPGGKFTISHTDSLGQLSFLDPESGQIKTVNGFASIGILNNNPLPRRAGDKDES